MPVFLSSKFELLGKSIVEVPFLILLFIVGSVSGSLYAVTKIPAPLFVTPVMLLFLPSLGFGQEGAILPVLATAITSFIPILLIDWVGDMKTQRVDSSLLISLSPGAAMGGVIGAQIASFMTPLFFKLSLSFVGLILVFLALQNWRQFKVLSSNTFLGNMNNHFLRIPVGMLVGIIGVMAGGSGKSFGEAMLSQTSIREFHRESTAIGIALFVSIAAMVGFSFPAKSLAYSYTDGFIGAIQLVSLFVLIFSQMAFYFLCRNKGNPLDRVVLKVVFLIFLIIAIVRVWFIAF